MLLFDFPNFEIHIKNLSVHKMYFKYWRYALKHNEAVCSKLLKVWCYAICVFVFFVFLFVFENVATIMCVHVYYKYKLVDSITFAIITIVYLFYYNKTFVIYKQQINKKTCIYIYIYII